MPGQIKMKDLDKNGVLDDHDKVLLGSKDLHSYLVSTTQ